MARKSKAQVIAEAEVNATTEASPLDFHNQFSNWTGTEVEAQAEPQPEVEAALEELEAEVHADQAEVSEVQATDPNALESLDDVIATLDPETVRDTVFELSEELDARSAFEISEGRDTDHNIHKNLKKARTDLVRMRCAQVLLATSVQPSFLNRSLHEGNRFSVYAIGKMADIMQGTEDGKHIRNAINIACMKTLFAFHREGLTFTTEIAKAAASLQQSKKVDAALRKHIISHTVSTATAPTQASSTMQALETLGVVKNVGTMRNMVYEVQDTPLSRKLQERMAA